MRRPLELGRESRHRMVERRPSIHRPCRCRSRCCPSTGRARESPHGPQRGRRRLTGSSPGSRSGSGRGSRRSAGRRLGCCRRSNPPRPSAARSVRKRSACRSCICPRGDLADNHHHDRRDQPDGHRPRLRRPSPAGGHQSFPPSPPTPAGSPSRSPRRRRPIWIAVRAVTIRSDRLPDHEDVERTSPGVHISLRRLGHYSAKGTRNIFDSGVTGVAQIRYLSNPKSISAKPETVHSHEILIVTKNRIAH